MNLEPLIQAASAARERAYAPYSGYAVGAALLGEDGEIFAGCNIENRSFGLSICAERVAIASAVAAGCRQFRAIAVLTGDEPPGTPCGLCREMLAEFSGPDFEIVLVGRGGSRRDFRLGDLLPEPFALPPRESR